MKYLYLKPGEEEYAKKIVSAIEKCTDGKWYSKYYYTCTCLGHTRIYDLEGREVTPDPNYFKSELNICGADYMIEKHMFKVEIYRIIKADQKFLADEKDKIAVIDYTPDYVDEYWKLEKKKENGRQTQEI